MRYSNLLFFTLPLHREVRSTANNNEEGAAAPDPAAEEVVIPEDMEPVPFFDSIAEGLLRAKAREAEGQEPPAEISGVDWDLAAAIGETFQDHAPPVSLQDCGFTDRGTVSVTMIGENVFVRSTGPNEFQLRVDRSDYPVVHVTQPRGIEGVLTQAFGRGLFSPRPTLIHANPDCVNSIWFDHENERSLILSVVLRSIGAVDLSMIRQAVPGLLKLMRAIHAAGLLVNLDALVMESDPSVSGLKFWTRGPPDWRMFVDPTARTHVSLIACRDLNTCASRSGDLMKLAAILKRVQPGELAAGFASLVSRFEQHVLSLGWYDEPDYDYWTNAFSSLRTMSLGEYVQSLVDSEERRNEAWEQFTDKWIAREFEKVSNSVSPQEAWEALNGPAAIELVKLVEGDRRVTVVDFLARLAVRLATLVPSLDGIVWIANALRVIRDLGLCLEEEGRAVRQVLVGRFRMPFPWLVCPREWSMPEFNLLVSDIFEQGKEYLPLTSHETIRAFWRQAGIMKMGNMDYAFAVVSALAHLSQLPMAELLDFARTHLPGFEHVCSGRSLLAAGKVHMINMAWICGWATPADVCGFLQAEILSDYFYKSGWLASSGPELIAMLDDPDTPQTCASKIVLLVIGRVKKLFGLEGESPDKGKLSLAYELPSFDRVCAHLSSSSKLRFDLLWMCHNPLMTICEALLATPDQSAANEISCNMKDFSAQEWADEIGRAELLPALSRAPDHCKPLLVSYVVDLVQESTTPHTLGLLLPMREQFCTENRWILLDKNEYEFRTKARMICPDLPQPSKIQSLNDVRAAVFSIGHNILPGALRVRKNMAFTDSIEMLTDPYLPQDKPRAVNFVGEAGTDTGGITREWISTVAQIAAGMFKSVECRLREAGDKGNDEVDEDDSDDDEEDETVAINEHVPAQNTQVETDQRGVDVNQPEAENSEAQAQAETQNDQPEEVDPGTGLFTMVPQRNYLVINPEKTTAEFEQYWIAFGRLMAFSLKHGEEFGIPLPKFFFRKFLDPEGHILLEDLEGDEGDELINYRNLLHTDFGSGGIYLPFRNLGEDEILVCNNNVEFEVQRSVDGFMPAYTRDPIQWMREGFSRLLNLEDAKQKLLPPERMQVLTGGSNFLDLAALKRAAVRHPRVRVEVFNWLFKWLGKQKPAIQRQFMMFATGTSTLSEKPLKIDPPTQDMKLMAKAHTCSNTIDMPDYKTPKILADKMMESIFAVGFSMA